MAIRRQKSIDQYPVLFREITQEWSSTATEDGVWLIYAANYLFRTGGFRWAVDPVTLHWRVNDAPPVSTSVLAKKLKLVLLTHSHGDHFDLDLIRALKETEITWVIPVTLQEKAISDCGLKPERIITPVPKQPILIPPLCITPFESLHWELPSSSGQEEPRGVPETGYLVEYRDKKWLLPGDIRDYRAEKLPDFGRIDMLFAHIWMGRRCALIEDPPRLEEFCRFCAEINPGSIVLAHLEEWGRGADDLWVDWHARQVENRLRQLLPDCRVSVAHTGQRVSL